MQSVTKTVLRAGLAAPVKILHITDIHLTEADGRDTPEHGDLMERRRAVFRELGGNPPLSPAAYFEEAIRIGEETGALLVNTGDTMDIHTFGNIAAFHRIADGHDMMFTPGGHEHQRVCRRTMEEPYPYFETVRPKLQAAFPEFDMDFSSRVVNGLNVVCADNSMDYYSKVTLARFQKELARGLPVIVFSHDPVWDPMLQHTAPYHPNVRLTPEDYRASHEMMDLLLHHPLVIATVGGHGHRDEAREIDGKMHYMTAGLFRGCCRCIEIQ